MAKKIISVTEYDHYSDKLPNEFNGYKIAVISDLHCVEIGENNSYLFDSIYDIDPDAVMMVGDMVNSHSRGMNKSKRFITNLCKDYPVYYSCGNHELKLGTNPRSKIAYKAYRRNLRHNGVYYLNNKSAYIEKDSARIKIYGLNLGRAYYGKFNRNKLKPSVIDRLVGKREEDTFSILLAHNPEHFESYAEWGADIVLSGHIHGGIVVLPYIGGVLSPSFKLFPHYDFGKFEENDSTLYLSRGLGWHTIPVRIFNEPEIMVITLHSK